MYIKAFILFILAGISSVYAIGVDETQLKIIANQPVIYIASADQVDPHTYEINMLDNIFTVMPTSNNGFDPNFVANGSDRPDQTIGNVTIKDLDMLFHSSIAGVVVATKYTDKQGDHYLPCLKQMAYSYGINAIAPGMVNEITDISVTQFVPYGGKKYPLCEIKYEW